MVPVHTQGSLPAPGSCQKRVWHRFQAFFRWVRPFTPSGLEFVQSSSTHSERVLRMPYPTTLSGMHRLLSLLCPLQLWSPGRLITQEYLPSFLLPPAGIPQRASRRTPDRCLSTHPAFQFDPATWRQQAGEYYHPPQVAPVGAQHNLLHGVPRYAGEQGPITLSVICFPWFTCSFSVRLCLP